MAALCCLLTEATARVQARLPAESHLQHSTYSTELSSSAYLQLRKPLGKSSDKSLVRKVMEGATWVLRISHH